MIYLILKQHIPIEDAVNDLKEAFEKINYQIFSDSKYFNIKNLT